jgi:heptaprenylglyceryl phosphate synthase
MKIIIKQVKVHGFEMWEAVSEEGDVIAQAWSKAGVVTAAKKYRKEKIQIDAYDMAQTLEQFYSR